MPEVRAWCPRFGHILNHPLMLAYSCASSMIFSGCLICNYAIKFVIRFFFWGAMLVSRTCCVGVTHVPAHVSRQHNEK